MGKDEQARQRLVEIALQAVKEAGDNPPRLHSLANAVNVRALAGFPNPSKGSWCAAGLTAAMAQAGLRVPAPGTPARRGAIALLDWTAAQTGARAEFSGDTVMRPGALRSAQPGDIIAWLQHPPPDPAGWRRGHVAVIVAVDDESITTVGWNEGPSPGRVMMRRLWRDADKKCTRCAGLGRVPFNRGLADVHMLKCESCKGSRRVPRSSTVLWRRDGGLAGIARPVAA